MIHSEGNFLLSGFCFQCFLELAVREDRHVAIVGGYFPIWCFESFFLMLKSSTYLLEGSCIIVIILIIHDALFFLIFTLYVLWINDRMIRKVYVYERARMTCIILNEYRKSSSISFELSINLSRAYILSIMCIWNSRRGSVCKTTPINKLFVHWNIFFHI